MDELLKAITGLINTGGDLADDALYLYFALQAVDALSVAGPITTAIWLGYRLIMKSLETAPPQVWTFIEKGVAYKFTNGYNHIWVPTEERMRRWGFKKQEVK